MVADSPTGKAVEKMLTGGGALVASHAVTSMTGDPTLGVYAGLMAGSAWEFYGPHVLMMGEHLRRSTGLSNDQIVAEIEEDPQLADMVSVILSEVPKSTADPEHLRNLASVLGYAVVNGGRRADARDVLRGLTQLSSRHVLLLETLSRQSSEKRGQWTDLALDAAMQERGVEDWRFMFSGPEAAGLARESTGFLGGPTYTLTRAGQWALEALGRIAEEDRSTGEE